MPDDMDWRLQGVSVLSKSTDLDKESQSILAGSPITMVDRIRLADGRHLAFPIPNPSAMMLDASRRAFSEAQRLFAHEASSSASQNFVQFSSNADAVDFAEHVTMSVFAAYTALECFANETIPPWLTFKNSERKGEAPRLLHKEQIERDVKLRVKLAVVLPHVFGIASPKGTRFWEAFIKLEKVRNRIVHMKYDDRKSGDVNVDTIWKALITINSPYQTAKQLMDQFLCSAPYIVGLEYENYRPVRPRWHFECPHK